MVVSSTGAMLTTTSSCRLWQLLQIEHVLVQFLLGATNTLPDYRLYSAALAARLLMEEVQDISLETLEESIERNAVQLDVSQMSHLVSFVRTSIRPKTKASGLLNTEVEKLSVKIVEAWLRSLPDDEDSGMGEVVVKVVETGGSEDIVICQGLLYPHEPTYDDVIRDMNGPLKVGYSLFYDQRPAKS